MEEKIAEINKLDQAIKKMTGFLSLLEISNVESDYGDAKNPKWNKFSWFKFQSSVWTGSQTCDYQQELYDTETMNEISDAIKPILKKKIEEKKQKLSTLIS